MALPAEQTRYTFADVLTWEENNRIELIDGEAYMMAPPSRIHQKISGEIFRQLANFLIGKNCVVYPAPFGVRLFEKDGDSPKDVDTILDCRAGNADGTGLYAGKRHTSSPRLLRAGRHRKSKCA